VPGDNALDGGEAAAVIAHEENIFPGLALSSEFEARRGAKTGLEA